MNVSGIADGTVHHVLPVITTMTAERTDVTAVESAGGMTAGTTGVTVAESTDMMTAETTDGMTAGTGMTTAAGNR